MGNAPAELQCSVLRITCFMLVATIGQVSYRALRGRHKPKTLLLLAALALQGCSLAGSVAIYKYKFKDRLIELCEKDEICTADVDAHFQQCVDEVAIGEMILTIDVDRSNEMNRALQKDTILCINAGSKIDHFAFKSSSRP